LNVVVLDSAVSKYVTQSSINEYLYISGYDIVGNKFKNIDLAKLKKELDKEFYIKEVDIYRSENGVIEVKVTQKIPIARIYTLSGLSFYIDVEGTFLPIFKNYASYVPVFNGNIPQPDDSCFVHRHNVSDTFYIKTVYKEIYDLTMLLRKNNFLKFIIDQIYVAPENEYEMIPKIGDFLIMFGNIEDAEIKLRNLEAYFKEGAPKLGWNRYSSINLKYTNQIVCTKK